MKNRQDRLPSPRTPDRAQILRKRFYAKLKASFFCGHLFESGDGMMALDFPEGTTIENMPHTRSRYFLHASKQVFLASHQELAGSPQIKLGDHFRRACYAGDDADAPAKLYRLKADKLYVVEEDGRYAMEGATLNLKKGSMVILWAIPSCLNRLKRKWINFLYVPILTQAPR